MIYHNYHALKKSGSFRVAFLAAWVENDVEERDTR